jgi:hypothetical protein
MRWRKRVQKLFLRSLSLCSTSMSHSAEQSGVEVGDKALLDWYLAPNYNYNHLMGAR